LLGDAAAKYVGSWPLAALLRRTADPDVLAEIIETFVRALRERRTGVGGNRWETMQVLEEMQPLEGP